MTNRTETTLTPGDRAVLAELRSFTENTCCDEEKGSWKQVYLDNALPDGMSPRAFAGHLRSLQKAGLYRPQGCGFFGDVFCPHGE